MIYDVPFNRLIFILVVIILDNCMKQSISFPSRCQIIISIFIGFIVKISLIIFVIIFIVRRVEIFWCFPTFPNVIIQIEQQIMQDDARSNSSKTTRPITIVSYCQGRAQNGHVSTRTVHQNKPIIYKPRSHVLSSLAINLVYLVLPKNLVPRNRSYRS